VKAGNLYVNRNIIGAVVGVQPFGGRGLSGTGPKAGGPLYLGRLVTTPPVPPQHSSVHTDPVLLDFAKWLDSKGLRTQAQDTRETGSQSALGLDHRACRTGRRTQHLCLHLLCTGFGGRPAPPVSSVLATGNSALIDCDDGLRSGLDGICPPALPNASSFGSGANGRCLLCPAL
jgi:RHH-type proline utilization regulon transcriptional repressor/proline dehydrogenase/delta 1-pyrroline-5-carboxylate dehydrogenase